jgi:MoaA/NifB/PqqE/SkfB family radical SAM enzyme
MFLPYNKIKEIEIELTGICNLSCPLCTRNYSHANHQKYKNIRPLNELIEQFNLFPELNHVNIAGTVSEPTLYPYILEFVEYLLQRNPEIEIDFYSNASILDEKLWKSLGKLFQHPNQRMIFTVCGSTQELHQKYRVGSKLENVLQNASWFREYSKNDECQYIIFEYNTEDSESEETKKLVNSFSKHFFIGSEGRTDASAAGGVPVAGQEIRQPSRNSYGRG